MVTIGPYAETAFNDTEEDGEVKTLLEKALIQSTYGEYAPYSLEPPLVNSDGVLTIQQELFLLTAEFSEVGDITQITGTSLTGLKSAPGPFSRTSHSKSWRKRNQSKGPVWKGSGIGPIGRFPNESELTANLEALMLKKKVLVEAYLIQKPQNQPPTETNFRAWYLKKTKFLKNLNINKENVEQAVLLLLDPNYNFNIEDLDIIVNSIIAINHFITE